jgi:hypothetical protein
MSLTDRNVTGLTRRVSSLRLIVITVIPRHPDKPHADSRAW